MDILLFAASLRKDSCNKKLIQIAKEQFDTKDCQMTLSNFSDFNLPLYNGDLEETKGLPEAALYFIDLLQKHDALVMASPEYNYSTPGILKNLIDWVSRHRPMPWRAKPVLLLSASPSLAGGSRGLLHTSTTLSCCQSYVFPRTFSLSNAYEAFDSDHKLKDKALLETLDKNINAFIKFVTLIKRKPGLD